MMVNHHTIRRQVPSLEVVRDVAPSEDALAEGEDLAAILAAELLIEEQRLSKRADE
jgi:hypothetical protein